MCLPYGGVRAADKITPESLTGEWYDTDGTPFTVTASDGRIASEAKKTDEDAPSITIHAKKMDDDIPYTGTFAQSGQFVMLAKPTDIKRGYWQGGLPEPVRAKLLASGHRFEIHAKFEQDEALGTVIVIQDFGGEVSYNPDSFEVSSAIATKGSLQTYRLSKQSGYEIGKITTDTEAMTHRLEVDAKEAEKKKADLERQLATQTEELARAKENHETWAKRFSELEGQLAAKVTALEAKEKALAAQKDQLKLPDSFKTALRNKESLEKDFTAIEQEILALSAAGKTAELPAKFKRRDELQAQLDKVNSLLPDSFKQAPQAIQSLMNEMTGLEADIAGLRHHLWNVEKNHLEAQKLYTDRKRAEQDTRDALAEAELTIANIKQATPVVTRVTVENGDAEAPFVADLTYDPDVEIFYLLRMGELEADMDSASKLIEEKRALLKELEISKSMLADAYRVSGELMVDKGTALNKTLNQNAYRRYVFEIAVSSGEAALAFAGGGFVGLATALADKAIETFVLGNGNDYFTPYDESKLRQEVFSRSESPDGKPSETRNPAWSNLGFEYYRNRMAVTGGLSAVTAPLERLVSAPTREAIKNNAIEQIGKWSAIKVRTEAVEPLLLARQKEAFKSTVNLYGRLKNALSSGDRAGAQALKAEYLQAEKALQTVEKQILSNGRLAEKSLTKVAGFKKQLTHLAEHEISKGIWAKTGKIASSLPGGAKVTGAIKSSFILNFASDAAIGLAVNFGKNVVHGIISAEEEKLWEEYFTLQIKNSIIRRDYQTAANMYWDAVDLINQLESERNYQDFLYQVVREKLEGYRKAAEEGDYKKLRSRRFFLKDGTPLKVTLEVRGPNAGELTLIDFPKTSKRGLRGTASTAFTRPQITGKTELKGVESHVFTFDSAALREAQPSGILDIRLMQR